GRGQGAHEGPSGGDVHCPARATRTAAPRAVPPDPRERFPYKSVTPRRAAMLATTSPILLFGVEAPAVSPTVAGPSGSQSLVVISAEAPNGLWRIDSAPMMHEASSMW